MSPGIEPGISLSSVHSANPWSNRDDLPLFLGLASLDALSGIEAAEAVAGGVEDVDATAPYTTNLILYTDKQNVNY